MNPEQYVKDSFQGFDPAVIKMLGGRTSVPLQETNIFLPKSKSR